MTAAEFFIQLLTFAGTSLKSITEILFGFTPVNIVLTVILGVMILGFVLAIIRGRKI